jgi:nitroreductase
MTTYGREDLLRAASAGIRAPSLHNTQPWLFRLHDGAIDILADPTRRLTIADPTGWATRISCGAATYNARLALTTAGTPAEVTPRPDPHDPDLITRLTPAPTRPPTYAETELFHAIPHRYSNRAPFWPNPVPPDHRIQLLEAARLEGTWLELLVGTTALTGFAQIADSADRVLRRDIDYQTELIGWTHADAAPDGVPVTAGAPTAESHDLLPQRSFSDRRRAPGHDYEPEPLIAILGTTGDTHTDQITAGQALQRVLLTATAAGLATSMISQPIEVPAARDQLRRALRRTGTPQMALRIGYGSPGHPSPRRPLSDVLPDER